MKTLEQVQGFLNGIPYINRGGCAIAALSIYRWLKKENKLGKTYFVFMYSHKSGHYEQNNSFLSGGDDNMTSCGHSVLHHNNLYYDGDGVYSLSMLETEGYKYFQNIPNEETLLNSINNSSAWNSKFERAWIEEIQDNLKIDLNDIKAN